MPTTLAQLSRKIARLQQKAETIKAQEVRQVIARIQEAIDYYGIAAADLRFASRGSARSKAARERTRRATSRTGRQARKAAGKPNGEVRFRDDAGNTWSGRGRRPRWYVDAIAAGKTPEQLAGEGS